MDLRAGGILKDAGAAAAVSALALMVATPALAADEPPECFDVEVIARITQQTPTVIPECDDCIIMRWPWVLELDVERAVHGRMLPGRVTVLNVQHTWVRPSRVKRFWIRRAVGGVYNLVWSDEGRPPPRCPADAPLAKPYLQPGPGHTLEELVAQGRERYGSRPTP